MSLIAYSKALAYFPPASVCASCFLIACIWRCKSFHYTNSSSGSNYNLPATSIGTAATLQQQQQQQQQKQQQQQQQRQQQLIGLTFKRI